MARQDGVIKLTGQMGGISFYKSRDGHLVRLKSGVDGERIKNDPAFARTRENGAEFGRAGASSKLLRTAFRTLILAVADGRMASRLTRQMMRVIQADATSTRGERNVIDGEAELLRGFEFNENGRVDKTFFAPYTSVIDRTSGTLSVDIPEFIPANMIAAPPGSTHFRFIAGAAEIDFEQGTYVASNSQSSDVLLSPAPLPALTLTQAVTPGSTKPLFLAFGIEFQQEVNGSLYPLRNGAFNALAIVAVDSGV
jgi:hypothetical protein